MKKSRLIRVAKRLSLHERVERLTLRERIEVLIHHYALDEAWTDSRDRMAYFHKCLIRAMKPSGWELIAPAWERAYRRDAAIFEYGHDDDLRQWLVTGKRPRWLPIEEEPKS